jgi:hypothetical protein
MKTSSPIDSNCSWTEPLLLTSGTIDRADQDMSPRKQPDAGVVDDDDDSKSVKRSEQVHVHRLLSFFSGLLVGSAIQLATVMIFSRLIHFAHSRHGDDIAATLLEITATATSADSIDTKELARVRYETIVKSEDSTWFNLAIWGVYHASLTIYLMIWVAMMTMAVSKVGWGCISSGFCLPPQLTRRACFLRTFFFINGTSLKNHSSTHKKWMVIPPL